MVTEIDESTTAKRRLILRDALAILSLTLVTVALFAVTLLLFRSFTAHRVELAQRWSTRGRQALQAGRPAEAIVALRTALSYAPGTRAYELLLAEALGEAGRSEESYQYFMGLWESEPGNGRINLELARLAAKRNERQAAVNFYRAAIYGTWEGDGVARRAAVRLEFARYLIAEHDLAPARMELLIAGGNAPDDYDRDVTLGLLLQQAGDPGDAWTYYQRAVRDRPDDPSALDAAGRLAYQTGDYESAHRLLERAQTEADKQGKAPLSADDVALLKQAARIQDLIPAPNLPVRVRVKRILTMRAIARKRMDTCDAQFASGSELPQALRTLNERWAGEDGTSNAAASLRDQERQNAIVHLVYDTEVETEKLCGPPTGDDALLFRLATTSHSSEVPLGNSEDAARPQDGGQR
jgi:tetratricopeptide (TPR) repeat protein